VAPDHSTDNDFESRWPQAGDRLFVEYAWAYDAHIVRDPAERFYRMPMGYKRAGDVLIDQACTDVSDRRNIVYAALFCYRQSIELFLKQIIEEFGDADARRKVSCHDLGKLWLLFVRVVDERSTRDALGLEAVEELVAEMHHADQASDGFRFPHTRDRKPFDFGDRGIDIDNLRNVMESLQNFFECSYLAFSEGDGV
jgi:hypothetical protein